MPWIFSDPDDALLGLAAGMASGEVPTVASPSRAGDVLSVPGVVTLSFPEPHRRFVLNSARDANPFFILYESLWLLAGRDDVAALARYNSRVAAVASDDGVKFNGSYGARWRKAGGGPVYGAGGVAGRASVVDQLAVLVDLLRRDPSTRRAVLQMWTVDDDLLRATSSLDVCCNLSVKFRVVCGRLWCAVFNRSNDLTWGALGSDHATFSFLLEYMAAKVGLPVGQYDQVSADLHVYVNRWDPAALAAGTVDRPDGEPVPLVSDPSAFDRELPEFVHRHGADAATPGRYSEPFLATVAQPMCEAHRHYRRRAFDDALAVAATVADPLWQEAATRWLSRRKMKAEEKML